MIRLLTMALAAVMLTTSCGSQAAKSSNAKDTVQCLSSQAGYTNSRQEAASQQRGFYVPGERYERGDKLVLVDFFRGGDSFLAPASIVFLKGTKEANRYYAEKREVMEQSMSTSDGDVDSYIVLKGNAVVFWVGGDSLASEREIIYGCLR